MRVSIIDYGMGNLRSVQKAFEQTGCQSTIVTTAHEVDNAGVLVLPGVGAFRKCFENLDRLGLISSIVKSIESGKPFFGICLGLQILFSESEEFGSCPGLGVISGRVVRFPAEQRDAGGVLLKIPHMGWNNFLTMKGDLFKGVEMSNNVYYVHSYYAEISSHTIATCEYILPFSAAMQNENFYATQFHPEKSADIGEKILQNFLEL